MIPLDLTLRAARMLEAGRVTVTFRSPTGSHITLTAKSRAPQENGRWENCPLAEAKIIFIEVPNSHGWNDKVGKITASRGFVADANADSKRVWCVNQMLAFLAGRPTAEGLEIFEEDTCGRCGRQLTDPVSIERGIGPECYGKLTGSKHETKNEAAPAPAPPAKVYTAEEDAAYSQYLSDGLADTDGYFGPLTKDAFLSTRRKPTRASARRAKRESSMGTSAQQEDALFAALNPAALAAAEAA